MTSYVQLYNLHKKKMSKFIKETRDNFIRLFSIITGLVEATFLVASSTVSSFYLSVLFNSSQTTLHIWLVMQGTLRDVLQGSVKGAPGACRVQSILSTAQYSELSSISREDSPKDN